MKLPTDEITILNNTVILLHKHYAQDEYIVELNNLLRQKKIKRILVRSKIKPLNNNIPVIFYSIVNIQLKQSPILPPNEYSLVYETDYYLLINDIATYNLDHYCNIQGIYSKYIEY